MSTLQMAHVSKFRYQRLRHQEVVSCDEERVVLHRPKIWFRFRFRFRFRRIPMKRRFRLKIPSLRRLWRKKSRLVSSLRISCAKVVKRFKDGQAHFGDLFAGNYLFMQVNPSSINYLAKEMSLSKIA